MKGRKKERSRYEKALKERQVKNFHEVKTGSWHIYGTLAYKTLGQYAEAYLFAQARSFALKRQAGHQRGQDSNSVPPAVRTRRNTKALDLVNQRGSSQVAALS